ncbi:uncharacterized protein LOC127251886 [Andrographis paniculata]|uniref:uncharacterized protein LOC127251886 n=1 Tax=Andrographis paniculata TaxID=175694 RepID=UPI0021E73E98|nr:uncharacterized protein LOC127251886 [Andrographis paniculata]XP_051131767.1 uncharacterized protein LOC127251886 [Andrographis paniculata]
MWLRILICNPHQSRKLLVSAMGIQKKNSNLTSGGGNNNSNNNTPPTIHECAESGDLSGLQSLLFRDPSLLNDRSALMMQTPLHIAASLNRVEIVKYLLGMERVEKEAKNVYGETPLHAAAKNGCSESGQVLLSYGTNVEARTNNSMTPLHLAVGFALRTGDNSMVRTLLEYRADCFAKDDEGLAPVNYIPAGVQCHELVGILCGHVAGQIQNTTQQIYSIFAGNQYGNNLADLSMNYTTSSSSGYPNGAGDQSNYEIKAKMEEFDSELSKIVGLRDLKDQLQKWAKGMLLDEKRRAMGMNLGPRKLPHMAFLGNPGTGKTTVARILGKLLKSIGVLSSDKMIEVQRTDLVGEYLGQTGPKTRKKIEEAMGGILFVDEAYRLAPQKAAGEFVDYGVEAMEEIMSVLEDGELLVVFAGYTDRMKKLFESNEGFCRRVTHTFQFDNYSSNDLAEMLVIKMRRQSQTSRLCGFKLHPTCTHDAVTRLIDRNSTEKLRNKMNGGLVDLMLNSARENLDSRLTFDSNGDDLLTITLHDLEFGLRAVAQRTNVD